MDIRMAATVHWMCLSISPFIFFFDWKGCNRPRQIQRAIDLLGASHC